MTVERSLPAKPESVSAARHFVIKALADLPTETLDELALMVSELATNCVVHAGTGFRVAVQRRKGEVRVEVSDTGGGRAAARTAKTTDVHGRGLQIVDALSDQWGVTPASTRSGKTVWLTLRLPQ